jgi:hypothetical protein
MAKRAIANKKTLIDPIFSLPPGSEEEFAFSRDNADGELIVVGDDLDEDEFTSGNDDDEDGWDDGEGDGDEHILDTPEIIGVITPQTLRRAPGGQQVVDVVIEAEEVAGAINYEIQVSKL